MKETGLVLGMPITLGVIDGTIIECDLNNIGAHLVGANEALSSYKASSEILRLN